MELFVAKVNGFLPLTFAAKSSNLDFAVAAKSSNLDFAVVLDTPLFFSLLTINSQNSINDHHNFRIDSDKDVQSKKKQTPLNKSKQNYK